MTSMAVGGGGGSWLTVSPEQFRAAARTLTATAQTNERSLNALDRTAGELTAQGGGWNGRASREFFTTWAGRSEVLRGQVRVHRDAASVLDKFAAELQAAQRAYGQTGLRAEALGGTLLPDGQVIIGNVFADEFLGPPPGLAQEVAALEREAAAVHNQVADADRHATTLLLALADREVPRPEYAEGLPTLLQAGMRGSIQNRAAAGIEPALAAAWFASLSPAVRERLIRTAPNLIGSLDGVPPAARDKANRTRVRQALADTRAELATEPTDGLRRRERTLLTLLGDDHLVMHFDNHGLGRAVVAVGDVTSASNVAVLVPGMSTTIDSIEGKIGDAKRVRETIGDLYGSAAAQDTAVVAWIGYDAPQSADTAFPGDAIRGGPALDQFSDGLMVTHEADPHLTLVAHSYGSTVTGYAAGWLGLPADDVAFIGSPGVLVDHAAELHLSEGARVWASRAGNDPVPKLPIPDVIPRWVTGPIDREALEHLALGPEPTQPQFGARVFASEPDGGHSSYYNPDSDSILNLGRIIADHPEDVR